MIRNYLLTAIRNFRRNKVFTAINIAGLAIGISASLVIFLIVQYEFSYEKFWPHRERIYRVVTNMHFPDQDFKNGGVPGPLPGAAREEIPAIEKSTFLIMNEVDKVSIPIQGTKPKTFKHQEDIILADEGYFDFVPYQWIAGNPEDAMKAPNQVVLTEDRARTYFSNGDIADILGKTITYNDSIPAVITGIVRNIRANTDFSFQEFLSMATLKEKLEKQNGMNAWGSVSSAWQFYVQLKAGTEPETVDRQLMEIRKKRQQDAYLATDHFLQPLSDLHFNSEFGTMHDREANKKALYGLLAVAAFLLVLACINFINLTTAQASQRAKEIGIRKTLGSGKKSLVFQFLAETLVLTVFATMVSLALTPLILKIFSGFIPEGLEFRISRQPYIILFLASLALAVTLLAGLYPAWVLSRVRPVSALKNTAFADSSQTRRTWIRKSLTVSQFVVAQFFIIATVIVVKQIRFAMHSDMGFRKDAIISFQAGKELAGNDHFNEALYQQIKAIPGISQVSLAGSAPATNGWGSTTMKFHPNGKEVETTVEIKYADTSYFPLFQMKLVAGRYLQHSDTSREYLVNETLARFLGYKDPARIVGEYLDRGDSKYPIVGVLADFHPRSLRSAIPSLAYTNAGANKVNFHVALPKLDNAGQAWSKIIKTIEADFKKFYPDEEFSYTFLDENIAAFYKREQDTAKLLSWSTGLAIFISCLGMLGLVIFTTSQRTKEIGIRKVLGASVGQIVRLLSAEFIRLVALAFIIAAPLAWWVMYEWLKDYAYRTGISWWVFIACGVAMMMAALLTLGMRTIRSAMANPVKALRSE